MFRPLCVLSAIAVALCGCTIYQQTDTFKEKYNVYAEPKIVVRNGPEHHALPIPYASPYPAEAFMFCNVPINKLEDFADAIIRRMDAKTLKKYLEIQDEIDTLYIQLRDFLSDNSKREDLSQLGKRAIFGYYITRDAHGIRNMFATVQYTKHLKSIYTKTLR
ncbi:MAG: hypothetical protein OXI67_10005 [Candidatus Poribacteria bacterium]|nr:hypothetical protein [Candidatus Poribacteria bacterium]